ncbi:hypothetical protein TNCV_4397471 [Trichonephila clavipes]|nr:hypothetical protein TNCV_4397471 [Trichonephila clavipes]
MPFRNAKRLLRDKFRQKRISSHTDLALGKSWSRLLDGQRRNQLSALSRANDWGASIRLPCTQFSRKTTGEFSFLLERHLFEELGYLLPLRPLSGNGVGLVLMAWLMIVGLDLEAGTNGVAALYWTARRLMSERTLACVIKKKQLYSKQYASIESL